MTPTVHGAAPAAAAQARTRMLRGDPGRWIRFIMPLVGMYFVLAMVIMAIAVGIEY